MTTFLDTNILIYLTKTDSEHKDWAIAKLDERRALGPTLISDIVYAEFSAALPTLEETDAIVTELALERFRGSREAWFQAGKAFKSYKDDNAGPKDRMLPDFIIGAIAASEGAALMTGNAADFAGYFPGIEIISP